MNLTPLAMTAALLLTSCASWKKPAPAPLPPPIDCSERVPAEPLGPNPKFGRLPFEGAERAEWVSYLGRAHALWGAHVVRLTGAFEAEVRKRAETAECLDRERAAGRIR